MAVLAGMQYVACHMHRIKCVLTHGALGSLLHLRSSAGRCQSRSTDLLMKDFTLNEERISLGSDECCYRGQQDCSKGPVGTQPHCTLMRPTTMH